MDFYNWESAARGGAHPFGSKAHSLRMSFSPQKGYITDINTPQFRQMSVWLVSNDPAGEALCGGRLLAQVHVFCGCEAGWKYCQIL